MKKSLFAIGLLTLVMLTYNDCSRLEQGVPVKSDSALPSRGPDEGTSTGNPMVPVGVAPYEGTVELMICMTDLALHPVSSPGSYVDLHASDRWLAIIPAGSPIGNFNIPHGSYGMASLFADNNCGSALSVRLTNSHGSYQTYSAIELIFVGNLTLTSTQSRPVSLNFDNFINALKDVRSNSELVHTLWNVRGSF